MTNRAAAGPGILGDAGPRGVPARAALVPARIVVCLVVLAACREGASGGPAPRTATANPGSVPRFDGTSAYELVERQVAFGPRIPGRSGHRAMADWLNEHLSRRADTLLVQRFEHVTGEGETLLLYNFLARFRPAESGSLLLAAHWDTRPISDRAFREEDVDLPVPGANDGASGTAVLLELAEMMHGMPPPGPVDLLFLDGEDYGDWGRDVDVLLGSRYFASHMPDGFAPRYGVVLDMVGDRDPSFYVEGNSNRYAPQVVDRVWGLAERLGFGDVFHRELQEPIDDDHVPLNRAGVPTIDIIDLDYPFWHTPEDTPDKVAPSSLGVVGTVVTRLIYGDREE